MKGMSPNFHDSLVELWDTVIPKLTQYLEGMSQNSEKPKKSHTAFSGGYFCSMYQKV